MSGCGNSCGCDGATKYNIEIDGKIVRSKSSGKSELVTYRQKSYDFADPFPEWESAENDSTSEFTGEGIDFSKVEPYDVFLEREPIRAKKSNEARRSYFFECSRLRCDEGGISLYSDDGELLFKHKGNYTLK